jgi:hypothetical protein
LEIIGFFFKEEDSDFLLESILKLCYEKNIQIRRSGANFISNIIQFLPKINFEKFLVTITNEYFKNNKSEKNTESVVHLLNTLLPVFDKINFLRDNKKKYEYKLIFVKNSCNFINSM